MQKKVHGSNFLNAINEHGLLTFSDYHFLLLLMSTPTRYLDMIFHGFDISADGSVEAKVPNLILQGVLLDWSRPKNKSIENLS